MHYDTLQLYSMLKKSQCICSLVIFITRKRVVKGVAYEKTLTGVMEKPSAWDICHIPQQPDSKLIYNSGLSYFTILRSPYFAALLDILWSWYPAGVCTHVKKEHKE